jgi:hypothetical protein
VAEVEAFAEGPAAAAAANVDMNVIVEDKSLDVPECDSDYVR